MKKLLLLSFILLFTSPCFANMTNIGYNTFDEGGKFGLKNSDNEVTIDAKYNKLIRLGESAWIAQKNGKYGVIASDGNILVPLKYRQADRMLGKYVKLGSDLRYGVFNEMGEVVVPVKYASVDLLFGEMFLTCRNFKYGITDKNGKVILTNKFDDIYMPKPNIMRLQYNGKWYEVEQLRGQTFTLPENIADIADNSDFSITTFVSEPIVASGYSAVTMTDYILKILSSISPAHEDTIDELILSQGADTVSIFMKLSWLPRYPITFVQKYYYNFRTPNNGPLSDIKETLKEKMVD